MGFLGWLSALYVAGAVALLAQLAVEVGAWPERASRRTVSGSPGTSGPGRGGVAAQDGSATGGGAPGLS